MTTDNTDLDAQRQAIVEHADPRVAEALALFNYARLYAPAPMAANVNRTRSSTTVNS